MKLSENYKNNSINNEFEKMLQQKDETNKNIKYQRIAQNIKKKLNELVEKNKLVQTDLQNELEIKNNKIIDLKKNVKIKLIKMKKKLNEFVIIKNNEIKELQNKLQLKDNKIIELEKQIKINEHTSTELVIKLDNKIYDLKEEISKLKEKIDNLDNKSK
jgi:hypothetical protein